MLSIKASSIEEQNKLVIYSLNYPVIESDEYDSSVINYINEVIYQDIICFKDVVEHEMQSLILRGNYLSYINTEYEVSFDKNDVLSITVQFSQLAGLYNITYSNSYNYDLDLGKQVKLRDIFKEGIDFEELLNASIDKELEGVEYISNEICEEEIKAYIDGLIVTYDDNFYIEEDGIVVYFSSYELDQSVSELISFKIPFVNFEDCLSEYAIERLDV